jgi:hypothetical protein
MHQTLFERAAFSAFHCEIWRRRAGSTVRRIHFIRYTQTTATVVWS